MVAIVWLMKDDFLYSSLFNASFAYYVIKLSFPLKYSNNKICLNKKYNRIASSHQVIKDIITSERDSILSAVCHRHMLRVKPNVSILSTTSKWLKILL